MTDGTAERQRYAWDGPVHPTCWPSVGLALQRLGARCGLVSLGSGLAAYRLAFERVILPILDRYRPDLARLEQLTGIDVLRVQARNDAAEEPPTPTALA